MDAFVQHCWQHRCLPATSTNASLPSHVASRLPRSNPSARRTSHFIYPRTRTSRDFGLPAAEVWLTRAGPSSSSASTADTDSQQSEPDINQLSTALNNAISAEDYALAAQLRDQLKAVSGDDAEAAAADWYSLGILDWLVDRAERVGYRFPTGRHSSVASPTHCTLPMLSEHSRVSLHARLTLKL